MATPNRRFSPNFELVQKISIPKIEVETLNNGIPLYFVKTTNTEISEVIFNFDAGVWNQPQLLVAAMTQRLLDEGTKNMSSIQIADVFDFNGAHFNTNSGMHNSSVKLMALNKYFPELFEIIDDILNNAVFSQKEFDLAKKIHKQQLIISLDEEDVIARNKLEFVLYGENFPYGWAAKPEDYDKLSPEILKEFYSQNYVADKLKIIVASNKKEEIIDLLNKHFGNYRKSKSKTNYSHYKEQIGEKYSLIERPDALQSAVRIGWKMFDIKHKDNIDMSILDTFLGGYFGSRLMQNIRQKKGYTYSIYSALISFKYGGSFQIISEVQKENKFKVVEEIKKEVIRLQNEPISKEELTNMRNYMMGGLQRGMDGNFTFARTLHSFLVYDLDLDYIEKYANRIQNVSANRIQQLAQDYLKLDEMFTVIVG